MGQVLFQQAQDQPAQNAANGQSNAVHRGVGGNGEQVLSDKPLFFAINSYTEGLSPAVMEYVLKTTLCPKVGGHTSCDEIGLPVTATGGVVPCGATAVWEE